jgi:hypothetical protein
MSPSFKQIFWQQFGAAIDMFENAITACPVTLWNTEEQFWYRSYHTLFFLDYYLDDNPDTFMPPAPFNLDELDPAGILPDRVYTKEELLEYLRFCRAKCHTVITNLTEERAAKRFINFYMDFSIMELLLDNLRHVQHHTAQLNTLLRQHTGSAPRWVARTKVSF